MHRITNYIFLTISLFLLGIIPAMGQVTTISDGCYETRLAGEDGNHIFQWTWESAFNQDRFGLGGMGQNFFAGDTLVFEAMYAYYPNTTVRLSTFTNLPGPEGAVPVRLTLTYPEDTTDAWGMVHINYGQPVELLPQDTVIMTFRFTCIPAGSAGTGDGETVIPPDDRVNWQFGDDVAVIFKANDDEGNPALHIYQPDGANPDSPLVITQNDFPSPMPPAYNTWIAGEGLVNVYVLTTGEIQFNIGPTLDGKVRVVIFPDLTGEGAYGYEYNIYNLFED